MTYLLSFPVGLSPTPIVHVSVKPPSHPGRSDFPSPVGGHVLFPRQTFPKEQRLKRWPTYTSSPAGYTAGSMPATADHVTRVLSPGVSPPDIRHAPRAPSPALRCYLAQRDFPHHVREYYLPFIAPTGSCARPPSSCRLRSPYYGRSLQVATSPCCKMALPDVISASLSLVAWTCIPAAAGVPTPVSSSCTSAFPPWDPGRLTATPTQRLQRSPVFRDGSHSILFRPLQVCLPPRSLLPLRHNVRRAAVAFTSEQNAFRYLNAHRIC